MAIDSKRMKTTPEPATARTTARVLLVDDEPKLRESLAEGLRIEEWDVTTASGGAEALQYLREQEFDLMILDWMLPDYDGMEVLRRARVHYPHLPILMITARCGHADQITARQAGASDYLTKPFAFEDLVRRSRVLLMPVLRVRV